MSSRNKLLNDDQKFVASKIYEGLKLLEKNIKEDPEINYISFLEDFYKDYKSLEIEYIFLENTSIFDENERLISKLLNNKNQVIMVAAKVGNIRLIDNLLIS